MDSSRLFFTILFLYLSWAPQGLSDGKDLAKGLDSLAAGVAGNLQNSKQGVGAAASDPGSMPCLQKLIPCQPYMRSNTPPVTCCSPLKDVIAHDSPCLCKVFNNPDILKGFNITLDQAMKLPKACGIIVDESVCKKATAPSGSKSPTPPSNSGSSPGTPSGSGSSSSKSNAAIRITHAGAFWFIASVAALMFSAV